MAFVPEPPTDPDRLIRFGSVAAVDLAAARCTVALDEGVVSGPVRWIEPRAGATRTWSPPSVGEQVLLLCPCGEIGAGVVLRGVVCDAFPPAGDDAFEVLGAFADGARLSYDPSGHVLTFALPVGGVLRVVGDLAVSGKVVASGDVLAGGVSLVGHHHAGVQPGTGLSGAPQ